VSAAQHRTAATFDRRASDYLAKYRKPSHLFHLEKRRRLELAREITARLRPQRVLDAGSGPGIALAALRGDLPGARLAGVDLSLSMLREARAAGLARVPLGQSLIEQLPFRDACFDLVYALGVLDYLDDPSRVFAPVQRVLEPGGHFLFTYPNAQSLNRRLRSASRRLLASAGEGVSAAALPTRSIDAWLTESGFELVERHFITFGNGLFFFPWQPALNLRLERWLHGRFLARYLGWSCLCLARKRPV
jgi:SAM-dependent methyltransferase